MPQSSSVNPANRGRINLATVGPGNSADLIYNVRKHQRLLSQQQQQSADNGQVRSGSGHNSLTRTTRRSGPSRPTGQTSGQVIMSRSASQAPSHQSYASPTASSTSRSHQRQLAAARSLSRSHEERSPRTGRRVIQPAAVTSNKNGLNRGHVPHQYQHTVQVQVPVVQQPSPHSSPSKNALAASITAQVSIGTYLLSIELVANH